MILSVISKEGGRMLVAGRGIETCCRRRLGSSSSRMLRATDLFWVKILESRLNVGRDGSRR